MLTQGKIDKFYRDIESLGLKRKVAEITRATGFPKSNISEWLSKKKEPSENFINSFYREFDGLLHKSSINVPQSVNKQVQHEEIDQAGQQSTLTEALAIIKQQNAFLQDLVKSNLAGLSRDVNNNAAAIQAEIRGYGKYQILKQSNWDDQEFAKAMAIVDRIYGEELRIDDGQGSHGS